MNFNDAIKIISNVLNSTGTRIKESEYDGIIVKKLEVSNTLDDGRTTNQTHIAITGSQMDIFPYLKSEGYFNNSEPDQTLKKYFILQVPVTLTETNVRYLEIENGIQNSEISFIDNQNKTQTSIIRSKRTNQPDQLQVSLINFDGKDFINFRKLLHSNSYLIILKKQGKFEYFGFGIIPDRKIVGSGGLDELNNHFFKLDTKTIVNAENILPISIDWIDWDVDYKTDLNNSEIFGENKIYYGVPGCGKSFKVKCDYCEKETKPNGKINNTIFKVFRTTFYADYSNSDFVGQIIPKVVNKQVEYKFYPGPFAESLLYALKHKEENVALVIEEINRGNAAAIFGDIFQLLDRNKDEYKGLSEYPIKHQTLYDYLKENKIFIKDETIRIPSNLHIIGTMNTSDQNVYTLDTAFQRRWIKEYVKNDIESIGDIGNTLVIKNTDLTWKQFLKVINYKIAKTDNIINADDKQLGAYFMSKDEIENEKMFAEKILSYIWENVAKFNLDFWFDKNSISSYNDLIDAYEKRTIEVMNKLLKYDGSGYEVKLIKGDSSYDESEI